MKYVPNDHFDDRYERIGHTPKPNACREKRDTFKSCMKIWKYHSRHSNPERPNHTDDKSDFGRLGKYEKLGDSERKPTDGMLTSR